MGGRENIAQRALQGKRRRRHTTLAVVALEVAAIEQLVACITEACLVKCGELKQVIAWRGRSAVMRGTVECVHVWLGSSTSRGQCPAIYSSTAAWPHLTETVGDSIDSGHTAYPYSHLVEQ